MDFGGKIRSTYCVRVYCTFIHVNLRLNKLQFRTLIKNVTPYI